MSKQANGERLELTPAERRVIEVLMKNRSFVADLDLASVDVISTITDMILSKHQALLVEAGHSDDDIDTILVLCLGWIFGFGVRGVDFQEQGDRIVRRLNLIGIAAGVSAQNADRVRARSVS
jgi:hypothetical protein